MPEHIKEGVVSRNVQSPLRKSYSKLGLHARDLSHQLEHGEQTAAKLLVQLEDKASGDPWAYLTAKSRSMYYSVKDECRQLLSFKEKRLREHVTDTDPLDTELLRFESKYEHLVGLEDKAQYAQNAVLVMEERDKMTSYIARKLLDQLGVDILNFEAFDGTITSHIGNFIAICDSFNSLSKVVKSMSKDEAEYTTQIIGLRRQQELFQEDLQNRNAEYDQLQKQYHSLRNTIKQVSILRQQHVIETLEARTNKQQLEIESLNISRRSLAESESYLKDRLRLLTDELEELKKHHEKSIVEIRPVLEGYIHQSQSDQSELQTLRREVEISASRLALIEEKTKQAEAACVHKEGERQHALLLLKSERNLSNRLRADFASQKRILTAAAAANISYKKTIKSLEEDLAISRQTIVERDTELLLSGQEVAELKNKISELEQLTQSAVASRDTALREQRAVDSLLAMQRIETKSIQDELDILLTVGFTPQKKAEYEGLLRNFGVAKDELRRVKEQNSQYERRLRDIEAQIQLQNNQSVKKVKIMKNQEPEN